MEGSKFEPVLRAFGTKGFDVGHVEDEFHKGLAAYLPFGRLMEHQIGAAIAADQFNDPVAGLSGRLRAQVPFVETNGLLYIARVKHYSVYWQLRPFLSCMRRGFPTTPGRHRSRADRLMYDALIWMHTSEANMR